eukprot:TRINITY_DN18883_c0_g1_i1.p1 TRINITY_DN18883_c0_g1~~TRINITY_DN18883_c0_g1_i1.p1  ORF type:complete len:533 (-),score=93.98 TRINITY_DN18883_c0_g1_i1:360-1958(-)
MANNPPNVPNNIAGPNPPAEDSAKKELKLEEGTIIKNRWKITGKIGQGAFGETYSGYDLNGTEEDQVAIKVERWDNKKMVLKLEVMALKKLQTCPHVVKYISSGRQDDFNFLVMERLGENIAELRKRSPQGNFTMTTTMLLGIQMIDAIEGCHNLCYIHRDIKPSNYVMGRGPTRRNCFLIDFGLARKYRVPNGEIRPPRKTAGFRGTARYASINSHQSKELGRRDDLWSLFYVLVEFGRNTLPWRKIKDKDQIGEMKEKYTNPDLVKDLPRGFLLFMEHLQSLGYSSQPDYQYLRSLLTDIMRDENIRESDPLDWELEDSKLPAQTASAVSLTRASMSRTRPNMGPNERASGGLRATSPTGALSPNSSPHHKNDRNEQNDQESIDGHSQPAVSDEGREGNRAGNALGVDLEGTPIRQPGGDVIRPALRQSLHASPPAIVGGNAQGPGAHHAPQPDPFVVFESPPQRVESLRRNAPDSRPGQAESRHATPAAAEHRDSPVSSVKVPPTPQTTAVQQQKPPEPEKKGCKCIIM